MNSFCVHTVGLNALPAEGENSSKALKNMFALRQENPKHTLK